MIYDEIKKMALEKGISVYRIEKDLGLPNGMISKWNKSEPQMKNLMRVANYLEVPVDILYEKKSFEGSR